MNLYYRLLFSCSVMSDSFQPRGMEHSGLPYPSLSGRICWNSCPSSQWYYPTISSSSTLFSFCFQSSPASGSFPVSCLFASGGQSIGASASALVLPMKIQGWFPLGFLVRDQWSLSRRTLYLNLISLHGRDNWQFRMTSFPCWPELSNLWNIKSLNPR